MNGVEWLNWMTENPVDAGVIAVVSALGFLSLIILARLAVSALGRRLLVGLGLRKKIERENPWATAHDRASYKLRPEPRSRWSFRGRA